LKINSELEVLLPADKSVRLLSDMMEKLDYIKLYKAYARVGRKPKTSPVIMFKVLVSGTAGH
jgi:transposase